MKISISLIGTVLIPLAVFAAPKYPFPQKGGYPFGIKPANVSNDKVQAAYEDFRNRFYEENGDKTLARIKWDTESMTVSEGIGYGMIVMVYMDNATNATKDKFDRLWKYYNTFLDAKGLMNWKINGFSGPTSDGRNAATDAEVDAALALMQAYKQWGEERYLTDAKALIKKIRISEVDNNGLLLAGDAWGSNQVNPSYFSTAALKLFEQADASDWKKVITSSYTVLMKARNATTGLVPDWCSPGGQPTSQGTFFYDAIRTPYRMALAYCWDGNDSSKTVCSTIASWITTKTGGDPGKILDEYNLDGSTTSRSIKNSGAFVSCLASTGLVDAKHQAWLDASYRRLQDTLGIVKENYYNSSLKLMNLLLLSGNMPNFWDMALSATPPEHGPCAMNSSGNHRIAVTVHGTRVEVTNMAGGDFRIDVFNGLGQRAIPALRGRSNGGKVEFSIGKRLPPGMYRVCMKTPAQSFEFRQVILP